MKTLLAMSFLGVLAALSVACGGEPAVNKFCKGPDGTVQDCAIACDVTKDAEMCKLYESKSKALCEKIGKAKCQEICDKDKNEHACAQAKTMK